MRPPPVGGRALQTLDSIQGTAPLGSRPGQYAVTRPQQEAVRVGGVCKPRCPSRMPCFVQEVKRQ